MFHKVLADRSTTADLSQGYQVEAIHDLAGLNRIRPEWLALQESDAKASLFLTFEWMAKVLEQHVGHWRVFVVRGARDQACRLIFPAWLERRRSPITNVPFTALRPAGRLAWAEYTGFLCDPTWAAPALRVLARYLCRHKWDSISLKYLADAERAGLFARGFDPKRFRVLPRSSAINAGQTDELICPQVPLPGDFDAYLTGLSRNRRQKMRKHLRNHVENGDMRLTVTTPESFDADLELMLELWRRRWAGEKSPSRVAHVVAHHRRLFKICNALGTAHVSMLWQGDRPLGGLGLIADRRRNELLVKITGRDPSGADLPVGLMLNLLTIRWAITRGFGVYDFGHGNEPYKYSFGARERSLIYLTVTRRSDPVNDFDRAAPLHKQIGSERGAASKG